MRAVNLIAGQVMRLDNPAGVEVACETGRVWITEERGLDDFWLQAGDRVRLTRHGLAIVEATQSARVRITAPLC
jgi:Protein of unknown function (DUF2917)